MLYTNCQKSQNQWRRLLEYSDIYSASEFLVYSIFMELMSYMEHDQKQ